MAIYLKTQPQLFNPVYNALTYTVDSTNKTQCNFRYIFDVYINLNYVTTIKMFPFGTDGWATVDISRIIQDYVSYDLNQNTIGFAKNPNSIVLFHIQVGEEYDNSLDCSSGVVQYPNLLQVDPSFGWNGALQYDEFLNYDYTDYLMSDIFGSGKTAKFLTNAPNYIRIADLDRFNLNFLQWNQDAPNYAEIKTYSASGSLLGTYHIESQYDSGFFQIDQYLLSFGAGPAQLNSATLSMGVQPVIDSSVYTYSVQLFQRLSPGQLELSELRFFEVDKRFSKYEPKRLLFLNRLGGFDQYTFSLRSDRNLEIQRTEYTHKYGQVVINSPNINYTYNLGDRGRTALSVSAQELFTYNSNWMSEAEAMWMEELFTSPEVYVIEPLKKYKIDGAVCRDTSGGTIFLTGAAYHLGHADFVLSDGGIQIPNGTTFNYFAANGALIGMSPFGSGVIIGYAGSSTYHTNIPASINAGALITGNVTFTGGETNVGLAISGLDLQVGDSIYWELCNGAECVMPETASGVSKIVEYDGLNDLYYIDMECTGSSGCIADGNVIKLSSNWNLLPMIVTNATFETKIKSNIKNINYSIDLQAANKINVQRN